MAAPLLFSSHVVGIGGAEAVLLDLFGALDPRRFAPHLAVPRAGPLGDRARELGVPVHELPIGGRNAWRKAASVPRAAVRIRRLAGELGAGLVVATSMIAGYAAVLAQHRQLACVWHLHIATNSRLARWAVRRAARIIVPSRAAAAAIGSPPHCAVVPNGVGERYFTARPGELRRDLGLPATALLIGIVGRLDPHKGHDVLFDALARLAPAARPHLAVVGGEVFADAHARIAGYAAQLRARAAALGIADRVHFVGECRDTAPVLAALDLLVVPSVAPEAAPRAIAEAQAAGCPVVASAIGGVPEMVADDTTGVLVRPADAAQLAALLAALLADPGRRQRLAAGGRRRADAEYRLDRFAARCSAEFEAAGRR